MCEQETAEVSHQKGALLHLVRYEMSQTREPCCLEHEQVLLYVSASRRDGNENSSLLDIFYCRYSSIKDSF